MRAGSVGDFVCRGAVWVGAVVAAPVLLVAGGPLYRRYVAYLYRDGAPPVVDRSRLWVTPGYRVLHNRLVRVLVAPTLGWAGR